MKHSLRRVPSADQLDSAEQVLVLAGAGMSADLDVPTYWTGDDTRYGNVKSPYGFTALEHAHATLYKTNPKAQSKFHRGEANALLDVDPEGSYYSTLLSYLQSRDYQVATTNVDHFFERSGFQSSRVWEVHGSYDEWRCSADTTHGMWKKDSYLICPTCEAVSRPNVLFFSDRVYEQSPQNAAAEKTYREFLKRMDPSKSVVLELGVGGTVPRLMNISNDLLYKDFLVYRVNVDGVTRGGYSTYVDSGVAQFCATLPVWQLGNNEPSFPG